MANAVLEKSSGGPEGEGPRYGGVLRFLGPGGADHLDTASAYYATSGQILRALTRQLFAYASSRDLSDPKQAFEPRPDLAVELPTRENGGISEDGRQYTIRIRSNIKWDTDPPREVTAHDFIRALKRLANPAVGSGACHYYTSTIVGMKEYCDLYDEAFRGRDYTPADLAEFQRVNDIAGVRALDDKTLQFDLIRPAIDFLNILAMGFASPVPEEYDELIPDSEEFRKNFRSCGPYRLGRYEDGGKEIYLDRNPVWDQDTDDIRHQYVEAILVRRADEPVDSMLQKLDAGEADLAWSHTAVSWAKPEPDRLPFPRSFSGYALNPYLVFNMHSPNAGGAIRNPLVRKAIAYAVDKVAISKILDVLEGVPNRPLHSIIPPGSVGYVDDNPYPSPGDRGDRETARALLVEAGHGDGLKLKAAVRGAKLHRDVMGSVESNLREIGIELEYEYFSQADYYGSLLSDPREARAGRWDIAEPGWTPDWWGNNGRAIVQPLFQTNDRIGTTNYGGYGNPEVDRLIESALSEQDPERAEEKWQRVNRLLLEDLPIVPLLAFAAMTSRYHSRRVKNAVHVPQIQFFDITNLWLEE